MCEGQPARFRANVQQDGHMSLAGPEGELGALARGVTGVEAGGYDDARLEEIFPNLETQFWREVGKERKCGW